MLNAIHHVAPGNPKPVKRSAVALLANDIAELLRSQGPTTGVDLRSKLGIASRERFEAAVVLLKGNNTVEQVAGRTGTMLRIVGDERPLPMTTASFIDRVLGKRRGA